MIFAVGLCRSVRLAERGVQLLLAGVVFGAAGLAGLVDEVVDILLEHLLAGVAGRIRLRMAARFFVVTHGCSI